MRTVLQGLLRPGAVVPPDGLDFHGLMEAAEIDAGDGPRAVRVHKRRARYTVAGCLAERTVVEAGGQRTISIAAESIHPADVLAAIDAMGLRDYRNLDVPAGLRLLVDRVPERYAVIDAGTNSIKFHVAERDGAGFRTLVDRAELTRLGEGLEAGGVVTPDALARTRDAIAGMVREADELHAVAIVAVGTAGLRIATNGDAVVEAVAEATGVRSQRGATSER